MTVSETTVEMPWGVGPETTLREIPVIVLASAPVGPPAPSRPAAGTRAPASHRRPPETPSRAARVWSAVWPALVGIPLGLAVGVLGLLAGLQLFLWFVTS